MRKSASALWNISHLIIFCLWHLNKGSLTTPPQKKKKKKKKKKRRKTIYKGAKEDGKKERRTEKRKKGREKRDKGWNNIIMSEPKNISGFVCRNEKSSFLLSFFFFCGAQKAKKFLEWFRFGLVDVWISP